jgi:hypothetical protein
VPGHIVGRDAERRQGDIETAKSHTAAHRPAHLVAQPNEVEVPAFSETNNEQAR